MEKPAGGRFPLRLLLADDHAIFSDALRVYLEKDFDIVGVVSNGRALVDEAIKLKPDIIVADVGMPLLNGLDAARRIRELTPKLRATDWVEAKARARQFSKNMTPRQRDIVQLFAEGRPMKEIAGFLDLSEKTVEFHKHHIMVAFNLKNNADLVLFALSQGLIAPDRAPLFIRPLVS